MTEGKKRDNRRKNRSDRGCINTQAISVGTNMNRFEQIGYLESARKKTRPRKYDLYDVFCAVIYVVQGGIQWRMLPGDYPKWQTVYYYFRVWSEKDETGVSILDKVLPR